MLIVAILGKTGSGKSTLERSFENLGYKRIISYTTRSKRDGEKNGVDYNFVTREKFQELVDAGIIFEKAEYSGNLYGSARPVGSNRYVVVLEPDGLETFKKEYGNQVIGVYLDIDEDTQNKRIATRGNTSDDEIAMRKSQVDKKKFNRIKDNPNINIIANANLPTNELLGQILSQIFYGD